MEKLAAVKSGNKAQAMCMSVTYLQLQTLSTAAKKHLKHLGVPPRAAVLVID